MKNNILSYIFKNYDLAMFYGRGIVIDFSVNPVSAVILSKLIEKHFNITRCAVFGACRDYSITL